MAKKGFFKAKSSIETSESIPIAQVAQVLLTSVFPIILASFSKLLNMLLPLEDVELGDGSTWE